MSRLSTQMEDFRRLAADAAEVAVRDVSRWSVGMHVQHCAKGMCVLLDALADGRPPRRLLLPTPVGLVILLAGRIPRGRAQSPPAVVPDPSPDPATVAALLGGIEERLGRLADIPDHAWVKHFAVGYLTKRRALRFLEVHNAHHRAIVTDILRAAGAPDPSA